MSDALALVARINLAAAIAIALVMLLRSPVRNALGAGAAYALWSLAPLAALAMVLPARVVSVVAQAPAAVDVMAVWGGALSDAPQPLRQAIHWQPILMDLWLAGGLLSLLYFTGQQVRFGRAVRAGRGGPAVIGILRPRIVTPADFERRYTPREQMVVLAHERTHIARQDSRINAMVALARCVLWFNPFVHVLAHYLRIDQELACDAAVVAAHPTARRSYAEALLKTQLAGRPLPLGCYWPARAAHPLAQRIVLLSGGAPRWAGGRLGAAAVALLALAGAWTAWAARPPQIVLTPAVAGSTLIATAARPAPEAYRLPVKDDPWPPRHRMQQRAVMVDDPSTPTLPPEPQGELRPLDHPRLLPPGFFGPTRKIHSAADWSAVEPGSAVRVVATMTDPEGIPLITDLTAFGSQSWYRLGYLRRNASHYKLFTSVVQHGDRLIVTAGLNRSFESLVSGSVELTSGETGTIRLPSGQLVTVTPFLRAESPDEIAEGRRTGRTVVNVERVESL